ETLSFVINDLVRKGRARIDPIDKHALEVGVVGVRLDSPELELAVWKFFYARKNYGVVIAWRVSHADDIFDKSRSAFRVSETVAGCLEIQEIAF
ncbi:MAG: hypothetical protein WCA44_08795, partial [Acidobacteriaceae bacterium]